MDAPTPCCEWRADVPSARELLEQADALMRRNRSPLMDDIPVLTDSVPEARPVRPARLRPSLPAAMGPDSIPMLTEPVPATPPSPAPVAPAAPPEAAKPAAVVDEGEPSDWLQLGEGEPSVIGDAPDSIAVVPPVEERVTEEIDVVAPAEVEASFDAELAWNRSEAAPEPQPASPEPPPAVSQPMDFSLDIEPPAPVARPEWEADTIIDTPEETPAPAEAEAEARPEPPMPTFEAPTALEESAPLEAAREPAQSDAERKAAEDARWASMAEEIRMQVLQRIDLFTDTGLRDQLGSRLQPIVDRASADLVATINQHVGDLLRSYVAEAIEREIESWRHGQRP
jgi:hypothetical protein